MDLQGIECAELPELKRPLLVAGFDGWGNALDVSKTMAGYLIRKLNAKAFGKINPDLFYRYDETRPTVRIENGRLKGVTPPGGGLYAVRREPGLRDLVILRAHEPRLGWSRFVNDLYDLCQTLGVDLVITLGSMYDNVLHTDRIVSGIASDDALLDMIRREGVIPINYFGPSAIHSTIHSEGIRRGLSCISLWGHCPYYLQGTTHFALLSHIGALVARIGGFELDTEELEESWRELSRQIQALLEKNPELQGMIQELRKAKVRGSWESMRESNRKGDDKVIHLEDFLKPR